MYSNHPAKKGIMAVDGDRLRQVVEINGALFVRRGPRYSDGYALSPVGDLEVVDVTDFATALRCRQYGLTLQEMAELGHATIEREERFNRVDKLSNAIDFAFDHPGVLASGSRTYYRLANGAVETAEIS